MNPSPPTGENSGRDFVDTNVLLYAYDASAGDRHEQAQHLVARLARARRGVVSIQVLQEFYVNAVSKIAKPLTIDEAVARMNAFGRWPVHSPLAVDVGAAVELARVHTISFWDAMIVRSASEMGCARLWTEDLNSSQRIAGVLISNPFESDRLT